MTRGNKLNHLCETIIEDILSTPDDQIVAETSKKEIESVRSALARAEQERGARALAAAKSAAEKWNASDRRPVSASDRSAVRKQFDEFRLGDKAFQKKATLAARKGETPTDRDLDGLANDYRELRRLEEEGD